MSRLKKILLAILIVVVLLVGSFLLFIGPWPVYRDTDFKSAKYYQKTINEIQKAKEKVHLSESPGPLKAGWSAVILTPPIGTPLGGYSARNGKPSTGVHDELYAKAIALNDGQDTVVVVGTDMLLVPPNVADKVRQQVREKIQLTPEQLYFSASHTHCGPGAWAPGVAGKVTGGKYNPAIVDHLANSIASAIIEAYNKMEPAKMASGKVDATNYIRNRTRNEPVDTDLNFMIVEQNSGNRCFVVRFSAHPTNYDDDMMQFSAEFPGALQQFLEHETKTTAIYLGGSLGSSSPKTPEAADVESRILALGSELGQLVLMNAQNVTFKDHVEIASYAFLIHMPPFQVRPLSTKWRLSPFAGKIMGVPPYGWFQACRVDNIFMVGLPFDFSGEISRKWKYSISTTGIELWTTSFSGAYCGYLSPDRYYWQEPLGYETGLMGWFGPSCEAFMTDLFNQSLPIFFPNIKPL